MIQSSARQSRQATQHMSKHMTIFVRDITPPATHAKDAKPSKTASPWKKIKADTLPPNLRALYEAMQEANKSARDAKAALTVAMRACMIEQPGKALFFSDRFGDLSYAYLDEAERKASSSAVDFASLTR